MHLIRYLEHGHLIDILHLLLVGARYSNRRCNISPERQTVKLTQIWENSFYSLQWFYSKHYRFYILYPCQAEVLAWQDIKCIDVLRPLFVKAPPLGACSCCFMLILLQRISLLVTLRCRNPCSSWCAWGWWCFPSLALLRLFDVELVSLSEIMFGNYLWASQMMISRVWVEESSFKSVNNLLSTCVLLT